MNRQYMSVEDEELAQPEYYPEQQYQEHPQYQQHHHQQYQDQGPIYEEEFVPEPDLSPVRSEAVKRIQKAKLYETLLSHSLFATGSADPEIQQDVEAEIKGFVEGQLEVLLGMRSGNRNGGTNQPLPFDPAQIEALSGLADRLLKRIPTTPATPTPSLNPVAQAPQAPEPQPARPEAPTIVPAGTPQRRQPQRRAQPPQQPQHAPQRQPQARPPQQRQQPQYPAQPQHTGQPRPPARRRRTENASEKTGKDLSQATSRRRTSAPMPPQSTIDSMNAIQADRNSRAPKVSVIDENGQEIQDGGPSSAHVGALLAKTLLKQGG